MKIKKKINKIIKYPKMQNYFSICMNFISKKIIIQLNIFSPCKPSAQCDKFNS